MNLDRLKISSSEDSHRLQEEFFLDVGIRPYVTHQSADGLVLLEQDGALVIREGYRWRKKFSRYYVRKEFYFASLVYAAVMDLIREGQLNPPTYRPQLSSWIDNYLRRSGVGVMWRFCFMVSLNCDS